MHAAYVKFIESFGARVVPIVPTETEEETIQKMQSLNGVLIPGGGPYDLFYAKSRQVYD